MVTYPAQGDIITVEGIEHRLLVVSNQVFNAAGGVIVCPMLKNEKAGALHIPVQTDKFTGVVLCEQLKFLLLKKRAFRIRSSISLFQLMDISDAIQGIFEHL